MTAVTSLLLLLLGEFESARAAAEMSVEVECVLPVIALRDKRRSKNDDFLSFSFG